MNFLLYRCYHCNIEWLIQLFCNKLAQVITSEFLNENVSLFVNHNRMWYRIDIK